MISFKEFLLEEDDQRLNWVKDAAEIYMKSCGDWKDVRKPLWRLASGDEPMRLRTTRQRNVKSKGRTAAIQEWIFSQPGWEDFPKRHTSIFCSTTQSWEIGTDTGDNVYAIYPVAGTKMAMTTAKDFN